MAKSKSFFGLRRGSTKSHTYSVLNGQQITKDRVQSVSNPKTQKQQYQRAIMATVMAAYSEMKAIEDHAFQGKKKGSENQREFMSRNLVAMRNAFVRYQEYNPLGEEQKFFAVGPKVPTTLPCEWIISAGSLKSDAFEFDGTSDIKIYYPNGLPVADGAAGSKTLNVGAALDACGLREGMQFTICTISFGGGSRIYQVYDSDFAGYGDWEFSYGRFIVKKNVDRSQVLTSATAQDANAKLFVDFLNAIRDEHSTITIPDADTWNVGEYVAYTSAEELGPNVAFDASLTAACGVIVSMVDEDLRSNSKMQIISDNLNPTTTGLTWDYVWDAWRNAGATLGQSDLYLEGGEV